MCVHEHVYETKNIDGTDGVPEGKGKLLTYVCATCVDGTKRENRREKLIMVQFV